MVDAATELFQQFDHDRYLAHLFIPAEKRVAVAALHAFALELARVRELIREPMAGEIRLTWWRDMVLGQSHGDARANPIASSLLDVMERYHLPSAALVAMCEARRFDLYNDAMPSLNDLEGYLGETSSILLQLTAQILDADAARKASEACGHGGVAWGMMGLLRALPLHSARGQCYMPEDVLSRHGLSAQDIRARTTKPGVGAMLGEMRGHIEHHLTRTRALYASLPVSVKPAFAALALVNPYLKAQAAVRAPFTELVDMAGWRKPIALYVASLKTAPF